jgi:hypothetical protein
MTCETEAHLDDIGFRLIATFVEDGVEVDISTCTAKSILLRSPSGIFSTKTASFLTGGTDGIIYYATIAGDFDEEGIWKLQGVISIGGGTYHSNITTFRVFPNLS